jgi:glyoxalase family protein
MSIHDGQILLRGGAESPGVRAALILIHGRGASAEDIFSFGEEVTAGLDGVAILAPQAAGSVWYPQRFLVPTELNEPALGSALAVIEKLVGDLGREGIAPERIIIGGFSQGACLSLEFAARNPRRYGAILGLSGALIGVPGSPRALPGSLAGTPVYLGCSDCDAHIPLESVEEADEVLRRLGGKVTKAIFQGMGHTVNREEVAAVRAMVADVAKGI